MNALGCGARFMKLDQLKPQTRAERTGRSDGIFQQRLEAPVQDLVIEQLNVFITSLH